VFALAQESVPMLFAIIGHDAPEAPRLRAAHLDAHLQFVLGVLDDIRIAGPMLDGPGGRPAMSLYVIEAADAAAALAFVERDPYYRAGVWADVQIRPFMGVAGTWVGGAAWLRKPAANDGGPAKK
jgi:uncharacterized protein YciI